MNLETIKKTTRAFFKTFFFFAIILGGLFFYFNSDLYESKRLRSQIEKSLKLKISESPKIIHRENYGWMEEGGEKALLVLNKEDCDSVSNAIKATKYGVLKGESYSHFDKYEWSPSKLLTLRESNSIGDFVYYEFEEEACKLFRQAHFE